MIALVRYLQNIKINVGSFSDKIDFTQKFNVSKSSTFRILQNNNKLSIMYMDGATASGPIGIDSVSVSESCPSSLFQKKFHSD